MTSTYSVSLVYSKQGATSMQTALRAMHLDATSIEEALGMGLMECSKDETLKDFLLLCKVVLKFDVPPTNRTAMNVEDFNSAAYQAGRKAGEQSRREGHVNVDLYTNPYDYGTNDWQLWNLGWSHELQQNG